MKILKLEVGQMKSNCYLVYDPSGNTVIIDPGGDAEYIQSTISRLELKPHIIIATHGHFDHVGAVNDLKFNLKIPFTIHESDTALLKRARDSSVRYTGFDPGPTPLVDFYLSRESKLEIENFSLRFLHTPGHTPGSICLWLDGSDEIFVGDLIFAGGGVGRTDFSYSDEKELFKSIKKVDSVVKDNFVFFSGHGETSTFGEFKKNFSNFFTE